MYSFHHLNTHSKPKKANVPPIDALASVSGFSLDKTIFYPVLASWQVLVSFPALPLRVVPIS